MDQLYIEIEIHTSNDETQIFTTVQSFVALYVYRYLRSPGNIRLNFISTKLEAHHGRVRLRSEKLHRELTDSEIICKSATYLQAVRDLQLPVYAKDGNTYIAGMCAVCRELVQRQPCDERRKLLGFKSSCLLAPAEASVWTRFCELDVVRALNNLLHHEAVGSPIEEVPQEVTRFEMHMNEPVRMHNIYKLAREQANHQAGRQRSGKVIIECTIPKEQLPIEHRFAEGIVFTIADLILYPCMQLILQRCAGMHEFFPLTCTWLSEVDTFDSSCSRILTELHVTPVAVCKKLLKIPAYESTSLYKNDPKRYKPKNRIYTDQTEVKAALSKLMSLRIEFSSECDVAYNEKSVDWDALEPEHEKRSALPQQRLERKRQQLQNLANAVTSLAELGDRIIDFCSGTGHLGILLALQLPRCTVILMENKTISLDRAKQRAAALNLRNCIFYQCNIDYFNGTFDLGTSLHACGTATDIVLQQCIRSRAKFICCPCCYGSIQPMPHISYPLNTRFRSVISEKDFLYVAHAADQAHEMGTVNCKPETTRQGQLCMDIVDTDRKLHAEEHGYKVILTRLKPEKCTPKNHLLVGYVPDAS